MRKSFAVAAASAFAASMFIVSTATAQTPLSPSFGQNSTDCKGVNACKGQSACKSASNACKGQNACKGTSFTEAKDAADCTTKGGKVM